MLDDEEIAEILDASNVDTAAEAKLIKKRFTGEKKFYYPESGKLKTVINYKNGYREGKSINYYENGSACVVTYFKNGKKNGKYAWYHKNGNPYLVINYKDDRYHGKYTKHSYGKDPIFEAYFNNGDPCKGMVTYKKGEPVPYAKIKVEDLGYDYNNEVYSYRLKLDREVTAVHFFVGKLSKGGCADFDLIESSIETVDNVGIIKIPLQRGQYIMTTVNFLALIETEHDIETITELSYNMTAEAR